MNELYYRDLARRFGANAFWKGVWVDVHTLRGSVGLYSSTDANCCPSRELDLELSLRGSDIVVASAEARPDLLARLAPMQRINRVEQLIERVHDEQHILKPIDLEGLRENCVKGERPTVAIGTERVGRIPV